MRIVTAEEMREIDREAIEDIGIPSCILMENAGRKVAEVIQREFPEVEEISVFCGSGNNGGDGLVCARYLYHHGKKVKVYLINGYQGTEDFQRNLAILNNLSLPIQEWEKRAPFSSSLIVDAILGTGIRGEPRGRAKEAINFINSTGVPVVSVDTPSGLGEDMFPLEEYTVKANITVTMGLPKKAQVVFPGAEFVGKLFIADIGFPPFLLEEEKGKMVLLEEENLRRIIRPRPLNSHKGTFGHLLILSGSRQFPGAPLLTAMGAIAAGAGLVTLAIPESLYPVVAGRIPQIIPLPLPEKEGGFCKNSWEKIEKWGRRINAIIVGPGISLLPGVKEFVFQILKKTTLPLVVDADALTHISTRLSILKEVKAPLIFTPHPGEMARLTGVEVCDVQQRRIETAKEFAQKFNLYLVLKGARTVIATPRGEVFVNPTGNPAMATGGMGDILTGLIGGFLVQGYSPLESSLLGTFLHGASGDDLWKEKKTVSLTPPEVAENIPRTLEKLSKENLNIPYFYGKI